MTDEEIEEIDQAAREAGAYDWLLGRTPNPYDPTYERFDIWAHGYRNSFARANGK